MFWPKTGATHHLPDISRTIKGLVVRNGWDLEPLDCKTSSIFHAEIMY